MLGQYSWKAIAKYAALMLGMLFFSKLTMGFGMALVGVFALMAIARDRPVELIFWTLFMLFISSANRTLFGNNGIAILTTRTFLIIMTAMLSGKLLMRGGAETRLLTPFLGILAYIGWECLVSSQGWQPIVSYLKLFLFFVIFLGMYGATNQVNRSTRTNAKILRSAILGYMAVIVVGSVLLIPFGVGQMGGQDAVEAVKNGATSLFMGMSCHSQALGVIIAMIGVFLFADLAFSIKRPDRWYLFLIACCPLLIYKSACRTAMGAFIAGCGVVLLLVMRARGLGNQWKAKLQMWAVLLVILGSIGAVTVPQIRAGVAKYVMKYGGDTKKMSKEDIMSSRQSKIDEMIEHIKQKPLLGNGFQVSAEMATEKRKGFAAYLSAPVEKSTWIFAITEEGGYIGMALFCAWIVFLSMQLVKRHAYTGATLFFTMLMCNMGEFGLFAMSYTGGCFWTLVFAGVCLDVQRLKGTKVQVFYVPIEEVIEEVGVEEWLRPQG